MSYFFRAFNRIVGQCQQAKMAYRPQANGMAERMVQTLTMSIKLYIADVGQRGWEEYAEQLTFAISTAQDRVRKETPFYLVHGWMPGPFLSPRTHSEWSTSGVRAQKVKVPIIGRNLEAPISVDICVPGLLNSTSRHIRCHRRCIRGKNARRTRKRTTY